MAQNNDMLDLPIKLAIVLGMAVAVYYVIKMIKGGGLFGGSANAASAGYTEDNGIVFGLGHRYFDPSRYTRAQMATQLGYLKDPFGGETGMAALTPAAQAQTKAAINWGLGLGGVAAPGTPAAPATSLLTDAQQLALKYFGKY